MIALTLTNADHHGTVTVTGDIPLQAVDEFLASLSWAIQNLDRVEVDMARVTAMDLACFQLFCSAHRIALQMKKSFAIAGAKPDLFDRTLRSSGSVCCSRSAADRNVDCLWRQRS